LLSAKAEPAATAKVMIRREMRFIRFSSKREIFIPFIVDFSDRQITVSLASSLWKSNNYSSRLCKKRKPPLGGFAHANMNFIAVSP
jgi:hypothetical protein